MALTPDTSQSRNDKLAKRDAAQQDVFLREVDDALRQDEMLGAMRRYGLPIGVAVALGLAVFGGYLWWNHAQKAKAGEQGEQLTLALDRVQSGRVAEAEKQLVAIEKDAGPGSKAAAQLMRAGMALEKGNRDEAAKLYGATAADSDAPQPFRDLATIRMVSANFDTMPPQQVVDKLKPLAIPGNPWFGSAGELVGAAYLKLNKPELAGPLFAAIARDKQVPETARNRARQLAGLLGFDAIDDTAKAAAGNQP